MDGVDGVLVDFLAVATAGPRLQVLAHSHRPFEPALAGELLALNAAGHNELHRSALAAHELAITYAEVVDDLLRRSGVQRGDVTAIGAHGQTVRHRPREFNGTGYTLQLNNPALLAERCGIDVVADFRSRDVAAGGQGAPLVPAFHREIFHQPGHAVAVINIGGISNLTSIAADGATIGFDCGPGNALMDHWCRLHTGQPFDLGGTWADGGTVIPRLLEAFMSDPYFKLPAPKSTGRDHFNPAWLDAQWLLMNGEAAPALPATVPAMVSATISEAMPVPSTPQNVQATLTELTARVCSQAVAEHAPQAAEVLVCGGGALNQSLMGRLTAQLPGREVTATDSRGLPAMQVEGAAFAWLAKAFTERQAGNLASVTGAAGPRVLGALYPA